MRIADKMQFEQVRNNVGKNRSELANLQSQAATQKRVVKPSDDPLAAARALATRSEIQGEEQFMKNINSSKAFLEYADQSLGELSEGLVRAKELALAQANDAGANSFSRRVAATEVNQLFQQAVQIGNRKLGDRFLFGGFRTTAAPFNAQGDYRGDVGEIMIQVNKDSYLPINVPGSRVFLGEGVSKDGVSASEAKVSTTVEELEKKNEREAQQAQTQELHAEAVPVRGPASIRKPHGAHPEQLPDHPALESEASGLSATWNTAGRNVFKVLRDLEVGLNTDHRETIQESLDALDEAIAQVVITRSQIGSRIMALDNNLSTLQKGVVDAKSTVSQLEDADTLQLVSDISKNQSTLQATLATSGKLIQPSLLDFLK